MHAFPACPGAPSRSVPADLTTLESVLQSCHHLWASKLTIALKDQSRHNTLVQKGWATIEWSIHIRFCDTTLAGYFQTMVIPKQ
jgi:hypothetical protein